MADVKVNVDNEEVVVEEQAEDKTDWKAKALELEAEAAKQRALKKKAVDEAAELKKKPQVNDEVKLFLESQLAETNGKLAKFAEKARNGAVHVAASAKLSQMGVNPGLLAIAIKSLDQSLVQYDEDTDGVDDTALGAAVSKLKAEFPALFERPINAPKFRPPLDGSSNNLDKSVITREEWSSMSSKEQMLAVKNKRKPNF